MVGNTNPGANEDHKVGNHLRVVHHDGLDGVIQRFEFKNPHFASVFHRILKGEKVKIHATFVAICRNLFQFRNLRDKKKTDAKW